MTDSVLIKFQLLSITILLIAVLGYSWSNFNYLNNNIENSIDLTLIENKLANLETGLNYLYASETNLTTSFEDREGKFPSASYTNELNTMIITTNNKTNERICELFLHELGHKNCFPDNSEECANTFKENNLYRCSDLQ